MKSGALNVLGMGLSSMVHGCCRWGFEVLTEVGYFNCEIKL